jgi:hypothetical protein
MKDCKKPNNPPKHFSAVVYFIGVKRELVQLNAIEFHFQKFLFDLRVL